MKANKLQRLISLCLVLCLLIGCLGVFPVTAATVTDEGIYVKRGSSTDSGVKLLYNRDFEDKTAINNGLGTSGSTALSAMEKVTGADGNTFVRFTKTGGHDYLNISLDSYSPASGSVVVQFDIMVESNTTNAPGIVQFNPRVRGASSDVYQLLQINRVGGRSAIKLLGGTASSDSVMNAGEWYTVTLVWSYTDKENVTVTAFTGAGATATYVDTATPDTGCTDVRPGQLRIGVTNSLDGSWCLDNLIMYTTSETDPRAAANHTVSSVNHGVMYNENASEYIDPDAFVGNYFYKVGVLRGLDATDNQVTLTEAPFKKDERVYIPVSALEAMGLSAAVYETVDGVECVGLDDVYASVGLQSVYSSMGLIALTEKEDLSFDGLDTELIPVMQKFIFDSIGSDLKNTNAFDTDDMITLEHPYIFADRTRFDELKQAYENPLDDPVLYSYISSLVNTATNVYKGYANVSGDTYLGMKNDYSTIAYVNAYGYDVGGRQGDSASHNERIAQLAFGYQITGNENWARLAYDYAIALGQWEHWGPGHFLNCADASAPYAMAYDWLYNAWVDLGLDVSAIEEIIFTHSILPAYYSIHDNGCPWYDPVVSTGWRFHTHSNNWNAVCSSGVTLAALAVLGVTTSGAGTLLDIEIDGVYNPTVESHSGTSGTITRKDNKTFTTDQSDMQTYQDYSVYLINQCLYNLPYYGMGQYAPDGSYIESNGYWSYGTNNFFEMVAALTSATGKDYGLLDCWGIDRTCYYAINTQSGDFQSWNYHDSGSVGAQDTSWFQFLGSEDGLSDKALAGIRKRFLASGGGSISRIDAIFYMTDEEIGEFDMPDIQYYMEGIDGYAVRDSWDKGSIFAGIMGNTNTLGHGQIDSGAFIYYSNGTRWFCDVGTENYNAYGFWGAGTRYTYYKMNAEGNNTLLLTSQQSDVPYGQTLAGFGYMTDTFDNEYGAYTIIDNTSVYGGYAEYAYRGMLFTNDRRTVVIQDEVKFAEAQSAAWVGHTMSDVIISVDGKTAYMYNGTDVLKVTLLAESGQDLKFEVRDTYDFLLDCCVGPNWSVENGGVAEGDRSAYKRLVIQAKDVTELKLAVVIEEVAVGVTMNADIGYSWCDMHDWVPTADGRQENTELADMGFEGEDKGSVAANGNLSFDKTKIGSGGAVIIAPDAALTYGGRVDFLALPSAVEYGTIGTGTVVAEVDIATQSSFPENIAIGLSGNGGIIASLPVSELGSIAEAEWVRCAVVVDAGAKTAYFFFAGKLVGTATYPTTSFENLAFSVICPEGATSEGTVLIDNVRVRYYNEDYTAIDAAIAEGDLTLWAEATEEKRSTEGRTVVATVTLPRDTGDTPIVDLTDATVYSATLSSGASVNMVDVYSFSALEDIIIKGAVVELRTSNTFDPIEISAPCEIITNGYDFRATSQNYIARVESGKTVYEPGKITVSWVIDGSTTVTEVYSGSVTASYKDTLAADIREVDNGDGTYSYYVEGGWSRTAGGAPLSDTDMTVTTANCTFYLTDKLFDGLFVTVAADGTVTGYYEPSDFYQKHIVQTGYTRVSITNSFSYDSTSVSDSHGITNFTLYLNGYTLYYATTTSSDHMFTPNSSTCVMNVYGPGEINSSSTSGNILYGSNGDVYMENVTLTAPRSITDTRQGTNYFKNCTVNITKNSNAFSTNNRNNAVKDSSKYPTVVLDGCTVNLQAATSSTNVFNLWNNSVIELKGGTSIVSEAQPGCLFALSSSTTGTVESFDYANACNGMQAIIGEAYHSCLKLYSSGTNDNSGATYDYSDKLLYGEGSVFTELPESGTVKAGLTIALRNDGTYPYTVVAEGHYGTVKWQIGDAYCYEVWLTGELPTPNSAEVAALIAANPPAAGMKYSFATQIVETETLHVFEAQEITDFEIKVNMTLHSSFNLNIYVPVDVSGIEFTKFTLDGEEIDAEKMSRIQIDGKDYCKIVKENLAPSMCAESVLLSVNGISGGEAVSITVSVSIPSYAKEILDSEDATDEAKALIINILKYAEASYVYAGNTIGPEYMTLKNLYESYRHLATASVVERQKGDLTSVSDGIEYAFLNLTDVPNFRFALKEGYTGNITLRYNAVDSDGNVVLREPTFNITDGAYYGADYIEIERKAFNITDDITIITAGGEAVYNLATYYHHTATAPGELTNLLNALYAYSETAKIYRESLIAEYNRVGSSKEPP